MNKDYKKTIEKWQEEYSKDGIKWNVHYYKDSISINGYTKEDSYDLTSLELSYKNIVNVIEESAELIFQLNNNQSVSILGYNPKINFWITA